MTAVDVWVLDDAAARGAAARWAGVLSPDERERALRYRFARDAERFTARRAVLRLRTGALLGRDPDAVRFEVDPDGKPHLADAPALAFSVSQTDGMALLAFSWHCRLGIDVERAPEGIDTSGIDTAGIARTVFSERERHDLDARPDSFFRIWTRKEAILKALGTGLSEDARAITTAGAGKDRWRAWRDTAPFTGWTLRDLAPAPAVYGAIAVSIPDAEIVLRTWDESE